MSSYSVDTRPTVRRKKGFEKFWFNLEEIRTKTDVRTWLLPARWLHQGRWRTRKRLLVVLPFPLHPQVVVMTSRMGEACLPSSTRQASVFVSYVNFGRNFSSNGKANESRKLAADGNSCFAPHCFRWGLAWAAKTGKHKHLSSIVTRSQFTMCLFDPRRTSSRRPNLISFKYWM